MSNDILFPLLSKETDRIKREEESEILLNGAKVVFDIEAALMPVNVQPEKTKHEPGKR